MGNKVKKKKQKIEEIKKHPIPKSVVVVSMLVGVEILVIIGLLLFPNTIQYIKDTFNIFPHINTEDLKYTELESIENKNPLTANLEILPTDYDSFVQKIGILTQHEKTTILRYGLTTHMSEEDTITDGYIDIYTKNLNVYIPQEYIDIYFFSQISNITNKLKQDCTNEKILEQLNTRFTNFNITEEENIDISTYDDIPSFDILTKWYMYNEIDSLNEYTEYISNQLTQYIGDERIEDNNYSSFDFTSYTGNKYFDTDLLKLHKMEFILSYIELVFTQMKIEDEEIEGMINELQDINGKLTTFWNDPTQDMNLVLSKITLWNGLNLKEGTLQYFLKSIDNNGIKTYFMPMYTYSTFEINDKNFSEPYDVKVSAQAKNSTRVPIFMYHQMGNAPAGSSNFVKGLYVTAEQFEKQLAYLVKMNYKTTNSLGLYNQLKKGGNPSQKTVMLTFDDGTKGQYTVAFPLLKKYGLTATFYIVSNRSAIIGSQLREMTNAGMEIASHSATHPNFVNLKDLDQLTYEIYNSKSMLAARTGKPVYGIAYPGCVANSEVYSRVAGAGYLIGGSCGSSVDHYLGRRLSLHRVHAFGDMITFKNLLSGQRWEYEE